MKNFITFLMILIGTGNVYVQAQVDGNVEMLYNWTDNTLPASAAYNNTYNEVWGFVQNGREYAIIGSTMGSHFFDVTDTDNIVDVGFVQGGYTGPGVIHRDYHDYNDFLYIVCDEDSGNNESTLQIVYLAGLPQSLNVVYDSNEFFKTSHNIFVDTATAKLYVCIPQTVDSEYTGLEVYSLENNPAYPELIGSYSEHVAHDVYVQNDTVYLNGGDEGLFIYDFADAANPVLLGSLTNYGSFGQGYNHSGWTTTDGSHYFFADENHGLDLKSLNVEDLTDMSIVATFNSGVDEMSMAHNLIVRDDYLFVSYYHDGLYVYDISDPANPIIVSSYKTYLPNDHESYRGAWGVYPHLPSGNILVSDMQYGLFVLDVGLEPASVTPPVGIEEGGHLNELFQIYPTITTDVVYANVHAEKPGIIEVAVYDIGGHQLEQARYAVQTGDNTIKLALVEALNDGFLLVKITMDGKEYTQKVLKTK